jgi:hypothetical protein
MLLCQSLPFHPTAWTKEAYDINKEKRKLNAEMKPSSLSFCFGGGGGGGGGGGLIIKPQAQCMLSLQNAKL